MKRTPFLAMTVVLGLGLLLGLLVVGSPPSPVSLAAPAGTTRYVKPGGVSSGDCDVSWANACELQYALGVAQAGDEIWVATGVYTPAIGTDRSATFQLVSGVAIYGGFAATETVRIQRDWQTNVTTLSGDLLGNDGPDFANYGENSRHVVTGSGTDATAVLDGFTINGGNANGSDPDNRGGGMYNDSGSPTLAHITFSGNTAKAASGTGWGGGMYNYDHSSPELTDVTFSDNRAWAGGGMYNDEHSSPVLSGTHFLTNFAYWGAGMHNGNGSNPKLTNVTFISNTAGGGDGGGMHNDPGSSPELTNVVFFSNTATVDGGGMANRTNSNPTLTNVTFSGNSADRWGGGMYNYTSSPVLVNATVLSNTAGYGGGMYNAASNPTLTNVTFSGNSADRYGGGMYNYTSSPTLRNCVLWGNSATTGGNQIYRDPVLSWPAIAWSDIQGSGGSGAWDTGLGTDGGGNIDADPLFADATAGDVRLAACSPAIDAGNNDAPGLGGITTDLDGQPRFVDSPLRADTGNGTAPIVDMGAYEFQPDQLPAAVFVDAGATGAGNGGSWAEAFTDLQDALRCASGSGEIWVAEGTYKPTGGTDRVATFQLASGVAIYGGFAATETLRTQRDWQTNVTILSGDLLSNDGDDFDHYDENSYHVVTGSSIDDSAVLDGFTISGGNANGSGSNDSGGGMYNAYSYAKLRNLIFDRNRADDVAGGVYNRASSPVFTSVTFSDNMAFAGGGMFNHANSSPTLTNVSFSGNTATYGGGGIYNDNSSPELTSVTFSGNHANQGGGMYNFLFSAPTLTSVTFSGNSADRGGALCNEEHSSPTLTNVSFSGNTAETGGGMWNGWSSSPTLTDVTFEGNSATGEGGGMYNEDSSPTLTDVTFSNNNAHWGGGMCDYGFSRLTGVVFSGNTATYGGGMRNDGNSPTLTDVTFITNTADYGGGMYNWGSNLTLTDVTLSGNTATRGGGVYQSGHTLIGTGVTVTNNAADYGGGMYNLGGPTVAHITVISNSATSGGGMYNDGGAPMLDGITLTLNTAQSGGGMYNAASSPVLVNATVLSNTAGYGGGMYNAASGPALTNVHLRRNTATSSGGGMYNLDCYGTNTPELVNVLFNANTATDPTQGSGGGMYNEGSSPELTNVTFAHNSAQHGGGVANFPDGGVTSNPALRNSLLWGNTGAGTLYAQQVHNYDTSNTPTVQGSTIQDQDVASPFVDADGADNVPGTADDDLRPAYPSYGIVDGGGDGFLPPDEFDLDDDGNMIEKLSLDLAGNARIYADYDLDGQADDPAILETDLIDQVDQGAYEAGCHPWHMQMGDPLLAEGRQYRQGFHSDLVEVDPGETISGTLESYASQQAGIKFDQAGDHYAAALACAGTSTQTHQALLGLQDVLWEQATAAMLRGNEEMVGALDVTISGEVSGIEDDIAALERAAGLYDQATDGYLRASRDFPQLLDALPLSRTLPLTLTEVFTQVDVLRLAMAAAKKSRANVELGELQFRNGQKAEAGATLSQGYSEGLYELDLLASLWPGVTGTVDYTTLVQNLGGMDRLYSYLQSGKNPFGYGPEFVPFHYRPDKDPERGSNNFEHTHWIADNLYLDPAIADAAEAEGTKREFDDNYTTYQAKLDDVESTYDGELVTLCGTTGGGAPDLDVCDGGTIQEQYQKVLGAKLRVEQVLVQMEMNNEKVRIEQQLAADLCEIDYALAEVMLENGEQLAILGEQEASLRFSKSQDQGIMGIIDGCISGAFGGSGAIGEARAAPGLSIGMAGIGAILGGLNAFADWKLQEEVSEQIGDVYAQKEHIYALEKAQVQYANCDKVQVESLAHLKTIVLEFANLEMEHAIAMNELLQELSRLNGLTSRAEYLLAEKAKARAFTQLLYEDPAGRVLRNHKMEDAYYSFEEALQYGYRAGRALDYEINSDVPYDGDPLSTLDDLYAINSTDVLADGLLQMDQTWNEWVTAPGRTPVDPPPGAIVYLSQALFEDYEDPDSGETVTAREQLKALIRGRSDPDLLTLRFQTSMLEGNKFFPTYLYNDRIDSIQMQVLGEDLNLCPGNPPDWVDIRLRQAGTSFIRTENATLETGSQRIDVDDIRQYDLEPKSVSVQAVLNDPGFPYPEGIKGLYSRSVAFTDWTLTIDTTQGAENPCLNLDNVDEIELFMRRGAYDLQEDGLAAEQEGLPAPDATQPYQPSHKTLPPLSLSVSAPLWAIPGLSNSNGPANLNGTYVGTIVISQPVYLPPVDLALVLADDGGSLSGYISPTLSYPLMPGTSHGPAVSGAWSGEGFGLQSEVFTTVLTTGLVISHQVLMHTGVISDSGGVLSGVYSETLAGLTPEPLVTVGEFWLVRPQPPVVARVYLPLVVRSTP